MTIFSRLNRKWFTLKQTILYKLVKTNVIGPGVDQFNIDDSKPVIFAQYYPSEAEKMVIDRESVRLGWPAPAFQNKRFDKFKYSFFSVYRRSSNPFRRQPRAIVDKRLIHNAELIKDALQEDIQIIPVRVFWGRAPEKEKSFFKIWLQNSGSIGGRLSTLLAIALNGRNTYVHFSRPISLNELSVDNQSSELLARKVARVLRVHNRHVSASVLGPDLSHRRTLVHQLPNRPFIRQAIEHEAELSGKPKSKVKAKALKYADEIASNISYTNIRFLDVLLTWVWNKIYGGINLHNINPLKDISKDNTIIYVPCHRSHIDYLLLSYILYHHGLQLPHIAAGINLNMPIVGGILRRGGAFFMRRTFKDNKLYAAVFDEYLHSIFTNGYSSEYFVEGGRSRTGRTLNPKVGMLAMTLRSYLRDSKKPIILMPVYTGYEKVFEANSYLGELRGKAKEKESLIGVLGTLRSLKNSFGQVHVTFGEPIYLTKFLNQHVPDWQNQDLSEVNYRPQWSPEVTEKLGTEVAVGINRAASINPINLLAMSILSAPRQAMDEQQLLSHMTQYYRMIDDCPYSTMTALPQGEAHDWLRHCEDLKSVVRSSHIMGDMIQTDEKQAVILTYYRNNVLHLYALPSLIACLFIHNRRYKREEVINVIRTLYPFIKAELFLHWEDIHLEKAIDEWLVFLVSNGYLIDNEDEIHIITNNSDEYAFMEGLSSHMMQAIERYYIALTRLNCQPLGTLTAKQLEEECTQQAQRVSLLFGMNAPEFFDKSLFRTLIQVLIKHDYVTIDDDQLLTVQATLNPLAECLDTLLPGRLRQLLNQSSENAVTTRQ